MKTADLNVLTTDQRDLLLLVFKDGREFYPSRASFDADYRSLSKATLLDLYTAWKAFNTALAQSTGEDIVPGVLTHLSVNPFTAKPAMIRFIRQVLGLYSRLEGHVDPDAALASFAQRVSHARARLPEPYVARARAFVSSWLGPCPALLDLYPKHGPGAVAEGLKQHEKVHIPTYFRQLDAVGGVSLLYLNETHMQMEPHPKLKVLKHPITRVISVPKDFSKPRIISAEPCSMQFLQQGVARYMMSVLESRCPYLNFRDQSVNALLAQQWQHVATLDMSDASDTVSRRIVKQLLPDDWFVLLSSLRSHFVRMPDGTIVPCRAFAPMGSALCFPVESLIFAAVTGSVLSMIENGKYLSRQKHLFRVYGDDIIVPRDSAQAVMAVLRVTGFKPNESKCCYRGLFRESCGAEWWGGDDVTVVRPRSLNARAVMLDRSATMEMPMALHAKALYNRGFLRAANHLASLCDFPVAIGDGPGYNPSELAWPRPGRIRWNPKLQRCEQEALLPVQGGTPSYTGDLYGALFLALTGGWSSERVLQPRLKPKLRWVAARPLSERG